MLSYQNRLTLIIFVFFFSTSTSFGQLDFEIASDSKMSILGTSNLHDWESNVFHLTGQATIYLDGGILNNIENLSFIIPVEEIQSGNSIMDGKTYVALKSKEHPEIKYQLTTIEIQNGKITKSKGLLTVAGITREIDFPLECKVNNKTVNVDGAIKFKMTDFNVSPPTALLGTLKTGDEIVISFNLTFVQPTS